jgi:hypothetical protein
MANITLLPENNYQMDTRTPAIKFFNNIANDVKGLKTNTGTNPVSFSLPFTKLMPLVYSGVGGIFGNWQGFSFGSFELYFATSNCLESYKLSFVNDIILNAVVGIVRAGTGTGSSIADYSFPIYLNLFKILQERNIVSVAGTNGEPLLIYPIGTIKWNNTTGFTCDISKNFRLSDIIKSRRFIDSASLFDFSNTDDQNANDKITSDQYNKLINDTNVFNANITFDDIGLSPAQITHLEDNLLFVPFALDPLNLYTISLSLTFTYFGLTANYIPI